MTPGMTCGDVAVALSYYVARGKDKGKPNRRKVRELARDGKIPPPIDMTLTVAWWRWSPEEVAQYLAGRWTPTSYRSAS